MKLFLCRHGETKHNCTNTIQGQSHSELTSKGIRQAEELSKRLRPEDVDFVYSSSMPRALKTAEIVAEYHDVELRTSDRIMEIDRAEFEGESFDSLIEEIESSEIEDHLWKPENGESSEELKERSSEFLKELKDEHRGEKVVVISHSGTISAAITGLIDHSAKNSWKLMQDNCNINTVSWSEERGWMIESMNDTGHLEDL